MRPPRLLVALLFALGCGTTLTDVPRLVPLGLQLVNEAGSPVPLDGERVDVRITGPGISTPIFGSFRFTGDSAVVELRVPVGDNRVVAVAIFDSTNTLIASGEATITIGTGTAVSVPVPIAPTTGTLPVVVTAGGTTLTVTPGTVSVLQGATSQLTVTITDRSGAPIAGAVPAFASSNPALASVSATGLITGRVPGVTAVTVTALGVAARVPVSVTAPVLRSP